MEFRGLWVEACRERHIISEFVREDLFQDHLVVDEGERICRQRNVVVRLGLSESEHLKRYEHKVRKNVRRSREEGLTFMVDEEGRRLDDFLRIYNQTMARTGASSYFAFPHTVFRELETGLVTGRGLVYFHVLDGERIVSTELALLSRTTMYSFLGGTEEDSMPKRPNDLLKHEAILWGGRNGFQWFVLGGGAKPDDGIYRYKEAFDPGNVLPFYTRQRIHDPAAYDALAEARRAVSPTPDEQFFPVYRG
jgi:hypothetical protein